MPSGIKTSVEKNIWKIVYPTGTVRYKVEFGGKGTELYKLEKTLAEARIVKAAHLKKHPELVPMDPEAKRLRSIERSSKTKVPGTKFIFEYNTKPGTYSVRISRAPKFGETRINLAETVVGLTNAKKRESQLITQMEKKLGRGIDEVIYKPKNPKFAKAIADVKTLMTKYNKLGYYPDDILVKLSDKYKLHYVKGEGANRQLVNAVKDAGLIDRTKLTALTPKYVEVVEKWKKYTGDKTKVGVKKALLEEAGLPSKIADVGTFRGILKNLNLHVSENIKLPDDQIGRSIEKKLGKVSALNIESFLSGKKLGPLVVTGKVGSLVDKMHLAEKRGLITVGEMGYGSAKLNQMLGGGFRRTQGAERHRTALNNHIDKIIKKHKGNPNAMYTIGKGPDSFDQRKFKNALQKIFGKTQGTVPLSKYIDQIINTEAQLMGYATDGIITTRRVDPITLERMVPPSNLSGSRTLPPIGKSTDLTTLQELGLEKQKAGFQRVTPRLRDFSESANLAFESSNINIANFKNKINPYQMKSIVNAIDKMLGEGLQNQVYENISKLSKKCRLLRAKGGRVDFATGGPCVDAKRAIQSLDDADFIKVGAGIEEGATGVLGRIRNVSKGFLGALGRFGPAAGKYGAIAAAGALAQPLVKQFMNDDPFTYLTDPDQQAGMLEALIEGERPKPKSEILDWTHTGAELGATAAAVPGTGAVYKYRRGLSEAKIPKAGPISKAGLTAGDYLKRHGKGYGKLRAGAGAGMKLLSGMFTPAGILATEPLRIAQMRREGESWGEIAKSPTLWMGPAFAPGMTGIATAGMKKGSMLAKALRLGMSPAALRMIGRVGMPGLALSAGLSGYDLYKDYKKKRGFFARDED